MPEVFDQRRADWHARRVDLLELLGEKGFEAARLTTINAHFTDPAIAAPMWNALAELGFEHGTVLEPGSGMGNFIGLAPEGARMTGVELDPTTAELAGHLYPQATIHAEEFEASRFPNNSFDAAVGNVPFGDYKALAHDDPATDQLVPAAEYLSGNVRVKLRQAHGWDGA